MSPSCWSSGPEVIAGSTRLKAGTATKIVAQHADDGGDGAGGEDLRQSDGRREIELRQAARSRAPHHRNA